MHNVPIRQLKGLLWKGLSLLSVVRSLTNRFYDNEDKMRTRRSAVAEGPRDAVSVEIVSKTVRKLASEVK